MIKAALYTPGSGGDALERPDFLESTTSSCYELDLPNLPVNRGVLSRDSSAKYQPPPHRPASKAHSPIYTNVGKTLSLGGPVDAVTPTSPLTTILEVADRLSSASSSDDDADSSTEGKDTATLHNQTVEDKEAYSALQMETVDKDNVYQVPEEKGTMETIYTSSPSSSWTHLRSSPDAATDHQSNYYSMKSSKANNRQSRRLKASTLRQTLRHKYLQMRAVQMNSCCAGSHSGAKRFFTFAGVVLTILLFSVIGVVVAVLGWNVLGKEANSIQDNLNTYQTSLRRCRIGRNWTSIGITYDSPSLEYRLPPAPETNSTVLDVPLDNLTQLTLSRDTADLQSSQLLLYVVVRTDPAANISGDLNPIASASYINVALWTRSSKEILFRQYMAVLSGQPYPQIVSRSFWFPSSNRTDRHFYARADLFDGDPGQEITPLSFRVYLSGYC